MRSKFIDFLKGIPIGISNVIPGFSGGTMAVILNIYERFINAFSDFFHHPFKVTKDVWALILGILVGILIAIKIITLLLINFPIPTTMYFVGLIIGSIPDIYDKTKKINRSSFLDIIIFFVCVSVVITLPFLGEGKTSQFVFDFKSSILIFFLAIIASATMVIPGVSGSLILLALGYYEIIWVDIVGTFTDSLTNFEINSAISAFLPVIPFILGMIIGIVVISKIIRYLINRYPDTVYYAILGLLFASPFAIIHGLYNEYYEQIADSNWISWVVGILTMVLGAFSVNYLSKYDKGDTNEKTINNQSQE